MVFRDGHFIWYFYKDLVLKKCFEKLKISFLSRILAIEFAQNSCSEKIINNELI